MSSELPEFDLSHEIPPEGYEPTVETRYASHIGHAVFFLGDAKNFAGQYHVDPDALAQRLYDRGVSRDVMKSLAVICVGKDAQIPGMRGPIGGWHVQGGRDVLLDGPDDEYVRFSHAVFVRPELPSANANVLHEAGHLFNEATGTSGRILYNNPQNSRRVFLAGMTGLGAAGGLEGGAALAYLAADHEFSPTSMWLAVGGLAAAALSGATIAFRDHILWYCSSEERKAERFARENRDLQVITRAQGPAPADVFTIEPGQLRVLDMLHLQEGTLQYYQASRYHQAQ